MIGANRGSDNPSRADLLIDTASQDLVREIKAATDGKGVDVVLNAVGGPLFEPALLSVRQGGRYVVIASRGEPRVSFNLMDFYHNQVHLIGVDSMKFPAEQIARIMSELKPRFEAGDFTPNALKTWPLDQGIAAYEAAEAGGGPSQQILQMRRT